MGWVVDRSFTPIAQQVTPSHQANTHTGFYFTDRHLRVLEDEGFEEVLRQLPVVVLAGLKAKKKGERGARAEK